MRYFIAKKPCSWSDELPETVTPTPIPAVTAYSSEAVNTGLVDGEGNPIMRGPDQIGFLRS